MNLYELSKEFQTLFAKWQLCEDNAQAAEIEKELDQLDCDLTNKVEACCAVYKNYSAMAEALKAEKQRFAERQAVAERAAERMKAWIQKSLPAGTRIETAQHVVSWRKSESIEVTNEEELLLEFVDMKTVPNKSRIKDAIKSGAEVPGAKLVQRNNLTIK